jgi:hypothetical protein
VFRAASLVLSSAKPLSDPAFKSISVTAEQWCPIEEVPPAALLSWLAAKKRSGCGWFARARQQSKTCHEFLRGMLVAKGNLLFCHCYSNVSQHQQFVLRGAQRALCRGPA